MSLVRPAGDSYASTKKFVQKFYQLSDDNEEMEADESDDPNDIIEIFKIKDNLFDYETPLCKASNDFNYLLKINMDLFTFDIQGINTYEGYELNNNMMGDLVEPWSDNRVPYQLCDHICEPYHFKNRKSKWPTCSSDIDGFCNRGELSWMVQVGCMTYFQDHKWYDEFIDGKLEVEALMYKAKVKRSWGDATPRVMKLCAWLKSSFENFHELDHDVLVKMEECWWKSIQEALNHKGNECLLKVVQSLVEKLCQQEQATNLSTHTPEPSRHFDSICYDDDDDEESTIPLNEIISQIPPSVAIILVLPTMEPEDSLIMGDKNLSTIPKKESNKVIKSSVEDLVPIPKLF
ncbi:hypothetical protein Tco_0379365 [Tanacetum coccineum]